MRSIPVWVQCVETRSDRHADPRHHALHRSEARSNLDRRPNYILAAYVSSGVTATTNRHVAMLSQY